jgi:hypothetical protein
MISEVTLEIAVAPDRLDLLSQGRGNNVDILVKEVLFSLQNKKGLE